MHPAAPDMADLTPLPRRDRPDLDLPAGLAVLGGAIVGGCAGYLLLTRRGTHLRDQLEDVVDRLFGGVDSALGSWQRAQQRQARDRQNAPASDRPASSRRPAFGRADLT